KHTGRVRCSETETTRAELVSGPHLSPRWLCVPSNGRILPSGDHFSRGSGSLPHLMELTLARHISGTIAFSICSLTTHGHSPG
ncbi:hypothetical protein CEXT_617481, partial [Caerostris extrusa]